MIAWINVAGLLATLVLTHIAYVLSVQPARLSEKMGERAYRRCGLYRLLASLMMFLHIAGFIVYRFYPVNIGLPNDFPWGCSVSIGIGIVILIPSAYLMYRGVRDAGEETMSPRPEHEMYGGIYRKIRHPQAVGELPLWFVMAFLLNSPFLVLFSVLWIPLFIRWCVVEEQDLIRRYGEPYKQYRNDVGMFFPKSKK